MTVTLTHHSSVSSVTVSVTVSVAQSVSFDLTQIIISFNGCAPRVLGMSKFAVSYKPGLYLWFKFPCSVMVRGIGLGVRLARVGVRIPNPNSA